MEDCLQCQMSQCRQYQNQTKNQNQIERCVVVSCLLCVFICMYTGLSRVKCELFPMTMYPRNKSFQTLIISCYFVLLVSLSEFFILG